MAYATRQDMEARYDADTLGVAAGVVDGDADAEAIERALNDATNEVEARLGQRYRLPLSPVPGVVVSIVVDLAMERLPNDEATQTDLYVERAKAARKLLVDLGSGAATLPGAAQSDGSHAGGATVLINAAPRIFGSERDW